MGFLPPISADPEKRTGNSDDHGRTLSIIVASLFARLNPSWPQVEHQNTSVTRFSPVFSTPEPPTFLSLTDRRRLP